MIVGGVDLTQLPSQVSPMDKPAPAMVPGRVVHIDADFLAYQVSADATKSIAEMKSNCDVRIEKIRRMSGAEFVALHLTPKESDKGGRYEIALLKEYQGNRKARPKPKYLHLIRDWMHKERGATLYMHCEADDGIAMAQYAAIAAGKQNLSVIATKDKDLGMIPGLTYDWDTHAIADTGTDPFGYIELVRMKSGQKVKGRGWKFFWAQLLLGDPADNISGLPRIVEENADGRPIKVRACGPVAAYAILKDVETNKDAMRIVRDLYMKYGKHIGFKNYRDDSPIPTGQAFASEAQLLWMRRKLDRDDVFHWIMETCIEDCTK